MSSIRTLTLAVCVLLFVGCENRTPQPYTTLYWGLESEVIPQIPVCLADLNGGKGALQDIVQTLKDEGYYAGIAKFSDYEKLAGKDQRPVCTVLKDVSIVPLYMLTARFVPFSGGREHIVSIIELFVVGDSTVSYQGMLEMRKFPIIYPPPIVPRGVGDGTGV